ncbi:lipopolysaccharide biosynthesis protein [Desulfatirhabdium butyrativorans]|uniref:lipopolysaccharide biosynthesis protein n=1 Tax=Desulfatirhabdium butyrativorans TaxID=340467 RepID=UPI0004181143|nr:oligosaccharide flippase family protein [Desulfatirhabdium butyrativorans]
MSGTGQRLILGSLGRVLSLAVSVGLSLVLTPFIIRHIGSSLFGLWSLIGGIMGFSGLLDLGLNSALKRFLPQAFEKQDGRLASEIFCSALAVFVGIGICIAFGLGVGARPIHAWVARETVFSLFQAVWIVLVVDTAVQFPLRTWIGYFEARLRQDILSAVETLKAVLRAALVVYALSSGHGIVALALITFGVNAAGGLLLVVLYRMLYGDMHLSRRFVRMETALRMLDYSYKNLIAAIGDILRFQIDLVVISAFCPLSHVAVYAIASRLSAYFMESVAAFIGMSIPLFSGLDARGNPDLLRDVYYLLIKIASVLSVYIGGMFLVLGRAFIVRWVGGDFTESYPVLVILTIGIGIALSQYPTVNLLRGLSLHTTISFLNIVEGAANLGLSLLLVQSMGLVGVALGTAIPITVFAGILGPMIAMRSVGFLKPEEWVRTYGLVMLRACMVMGIYAAAVHFWIVPDYLRLTAAAGLSLIYFPVIYGIAFTGTEKQHYLRAGERIRSLLQWRSAHSG